MLKNSKFYLLLILLIAFLLRFYDLGKIPNGLYQDETAIGYNAYSILTTGKDEWGEQFPLYFKSFGDYKLPVYIYLDVPAVIIFGLNAFAVRFPSALFGWGAVVIMYFLIKELTGNIKISLLATLLLAVNPWHLHYSRATFEVSISLFLFMLGFFFLQKSFVKKNTWFFLLGSLCFVFDIYTYNLTRLLSPLLYLLIIFFHKTNIKNLNRKGILLTIFFSATLLIPLLLSFFDKGGLNSARGTLIFSSQAVLANVLEFRGYFADLPSILNKLFFNNIFLLIWQFIKNVYSYFSVEFYFLTGSSHGNHGIGTNGQFYMFELITIITGIFISVLKKEKWAKILLGWATLTILVASLTREAPQATRSFFLVFPLTIFSAFGAVQIFDKIKRIQQPSQKIPIIIICTSFILFSLIYYFSAYYIRFPVAYAQSWRYQDGELMKYINGVADDYDEIIFSGNSGFIYTSYLFYNQFDPSLFQQSVKREADDNEGFSQVLSFGKIYFKKIDWEKDSTRPPKRLFIVSSAEKFPGNPVKSFYFPKRPVAISVKEKIFQYPTEEVSYYLYESPKQN